MIVTLNYLTLQNKLANVDAASGSKTFPAGGSLKPRQCARTVTRAENSTIYNMTIIFGTQYRDRHAKLSENPSLISAVLYIDEY